MEYSKHSDNVLVFDPYKIRPGTICDVEILYSVKYETPWDSDSSFEHDIVGLVTKIDSVHCDVTQLPKNIVNIVPNDGGFKITIDPIYQGDVNLTIFYYEKVTQIITSQVAFDSSHSTYYKDYVEKDNVITPKAVLELQDIAGSYKIKKVKVTSKATNNGITYLDELLAKINSSGLLEYNNEYVYVLKKGKEQVKLPLDSDIPYLRIEGNKKVVEIDNMAWQDGYNETRGILAYNNLILLLTNKSLCVFNINSDFQTPLLEDTNIQGYDLTYLEDDTILVSKDTKLYKYRIRHNNIWVDTEEGRIYFREINPNISVTNV